MNICITNYDTLPQYIGGIKRVSSILANELKHECNIFLISAAPLGTKYDYFSTAQQYVLPDTNNIFSDENVTFFSNTIKEKNIDIILHQHIESKEFTDLCIQVKKICNTKLICCNHFSVTYKIDAIKSSFFNKYKLGTNIKAWIIDLLLYIKFHYITKRNVENEIKQNFKYLIKFSDKLVLLSDKYKNELARIINADIHENDKITYIHNPIKISKKEKGGKKNKKIVWCGRVDFGIKRIDRILNIWKKIYAKHSEWELYIIGSGNIDFYKNITQKHNIKNIHFTGFCDPAEHYKDGAILCMTSSSEGWGMVLIEAMQYSCVPIAYQSFASITDIITNDINGYTIPAFNERLFIEKLELLMSDDVTRERLAQNGAETIQKFSADKIAKQWVNLFNELMS